MTQTTPNRKQEIKSIHLQYEDFYRIGGGLFIICILIVLGSWLLGQNQFGYDDTLLGYVTNVATEALSVIATIVVIDQLNRSRDREERKFSLFRQAKSRSNNSAIDALDQIQGSNLWELFTQYYSINHERYNVDLSNVKWAGDVQLQKLNLREFYLRGADLRGAQLWSVNLEGADLRDANLQRSDLRDGNLQYANLLDVNFEEAQLGSANLRHAQLSSANLQRVDLGGANLQKAFLWNANLQGANLGGVNLQEAFLWDANLQEVNLAGANLQSAVLLGANLQQTDLTGVNLVGAKLNRRTKFDNETILPDAMYIGRNEDGSPLYDKYWTPDTDMSRFTDPSHPDFWQPPHHE